MVLKKLGHVVLKVRDLERSEAFYTSVLGLVVTGRLPGRMVFFSVPGNGDSHDLGLWKVGPEAAPQAPGRWGCSTSPGRWSERRTCRPSTTRSWHEGWQCVRPWTTARTSRCTSKTPMATCSRSRSRSPGRPGRPGRNPFAGREPLPFQAVRAEARPVPDPHGAGPGRARPLRGGDLREAHPGRGARARRLVLADTVGAILGGSQEPEVRRLHAGADRAAGPATVLGAGFALVEPWWAIVANGLAGTMLELDEGNRFARGHPGIHVLPAALAEAERLGQSGGGPSRRAGGGLRRGGAAGRRRRRSGPGCTCTGSTGPWARPPPSPGCVSSTGGHRAGARRGGRPHARDVLAHGARRRDRAERLRGRRGGQRLARRRSGGRRDHGASRHAARDLRPDQRLRAGRGRRAWIASASASRSRATTSSATPAAGTTTPPSTRSRSSWPTTAVARRADRVDPRRDLGARGHDERSGPGRLAGRQVLDPVHARRPARPGSWGDCGVGGLQGAGAVGSRACALSPGGSRSWRIRRSPR